MTALVIAAPSSGAGKTTITLGLLRAFRNAGVAVRSAKSGPDYIDPQYHAAASGALCVNLDAWAMSRDNLRARAATNDLLIIEGAMGLFDGAPPKGRGSSADLAKALGVPVVLVVDAAKQAQSIAALVSGFMHHDKALSIAGVILNNVGSARHERMLRSVLEPAGVRIFGAVPRNREVALPSRHLGLVQAQEMLGLDDFLENAAAHIEKHINIKAVRDVSQASASPSKGLKTLPPPAQSIAIARDDAFLFTYPHLLEAWRADGAELRFFSPLADEAPPKADLVYLPGGYPELHAGKLAANSHFLEGLRDTAAVYGECGGYMVMGDGMVDADGQRHAMAGLLRLETDFSNRKMALGYRSLMPQAGPWNMALSAHEFHFTTTLSAKGDPLFAATDAEGTALPPMGLVNGAHCGSFAHVIDRHPEQA